MLRACSSAASSRVALATARCPNEGRVDASPREAGQSLAEFALVLIPLLAVLLGIIQFGFIFNAYVTVSNAAREGARAGSIYVADPDSSQSANDSSRNGYINDVIDGSLGFLNPANATVNVTYPPSSSTGQCQGTSSDVRRKDGCVRVTITYDLTLIIPFIADIVGSGTMPITAESQMVVN